MLRPYRAHLLVRGKLAPRCLRAGFRKGFHFFGRELNDRLFLTKKLQQEPRNVILHRRWEAAGGFNGLFKKLCHNGSIAQSAENVTIMLHRSAPEPPEIHPRSANNRASSRSVLNPPPDYRIIAAAVECGAAWKKTARDSVREYLSVKLDDPIFPAPIYASLVKGVGDNSFNLIWSRRTGE